MLSHPHNMLLMTYAERNSTSDFDWRPPATQGKSLRNKGNKELQTGWRESLYSDPVSTHSQLHSASFGLGCFHFLCPGSCWCWSSTIVAAHKQRQWPCHWVDKDIKATSPTPSPCSRLIHSFLLSEIRQYKMGGELLHESFLKVMAWRQLPQIKIKPHIHVSRAALFEKQTFARSGQTFEAVALVNFTHLTQRVQDFFFFFNLDR